MVEAEVGADRVVGRSRRTRHWAGLDGLRAVAVAAVVAFHMSPGALPGGFLGVDVFFVISGFLITSGLVAEWRRQRRIGLARFWLRRVRRLYPAVLALIAVLVLVTAVDSPAALAGARTTIPVSLVYLTNWWFVFHHVPYFQAIDRPPLLLHFWSLAIEEQYYLIWPPILVLALTRRVRPALLAVAAVVLAVGSAVAMAALYHPGLSTDRIYYGSDTHAQGLLIGSALGLVIAPERFTRAISAQARRLVDAAGLVALAGVVAAACLLGESDGATWRGGIGLVSLLTGVVVVVAVHPASRVARGLGMRPLRWLGTRSYSVYLWHWPVLDLTRPHQDVSFGGWPLVVMRLALIAAASELSYRLVEQPWRTGRAQRWLRAAAARERRTWRVAGAGATVAGAAIVGLVLAASPPPPPGALALEATAAASRPVTGLQLTGAAAVHQLRATTIPPWQRGRPTTVTTVPPAQPPAPPLLPAGMLSAGRAGPVLAIGDSVMLAASPDLQLAFGRPLTVDAAVGRQVADGLARLAAYRQAGRLQGLRALVVGLGTNGPFDSAQMQDLLRLTAGIPRVVLVNVRVPLPWQAESNATIASVAHRPGWSVADWQAASSTPGVLYPDLVHPDPAGQLFYTNVVVRAVVG